MAKTYSSIIGTPRTQKIKVLLIIGLLALASVLVLISPDGPLRASGASSDTTISVSPAQVGPYGDDLLGANISPWGGYWPDNRYNPLIEDMGMSIMRVGHGLKWMIDMEQFYPARGQWDWDAGGSKSFNNQIAWWKSQNMPIVYTLNDELSTAMLNQDGSLDYDEIAYAWAGHIKYLVDSGVNVKYVEIGNEVDIAPMEGIQKPPVSGTSLPANNTFIDPHNPPTAENEYIKLWEAVYPAIKGATPGVKVSAYPSGQGQSTTPYFPYSYLYTQSPYKPDFFPVHIYSFAGNPGAQTVVDSTWKYSDNYHVSWDGTIKSTREAFAGWGVSVPEMAITEFNYDGLGQYSTANQMWDAIYYASALTNAANSGFTMATFWEAFAGSNTDELISDIYIDPTPKLKSQALAMRLLKQFKGSGRQIFQSEVDTDDNANHVDWQGTPINDPFISKRVESLVTKDALGDYKLLLINKNLSQSHSINYALAGVASGDFQANLYSSRDALLNESPQVVTGSIVNGTFNINTPPSTLAVIDITNIDGSIDNTSPTVSITNPADGATVFGTLNLKASASDNVGISKVEFYVDGVLVVTDTAAPYEYAWNTTGETNESHNLKAIAYDSSDLYSQDDIDVEVWNPPAAAGPLVSFTFDDGDKNQYTDFYPILRNLGFPGVVYINTGSIGGGASFSIADLNDMKSNGWEISSHTSDHWTNLPQNPTASDYEGPVQAAKNWLDQNGFPNSGFASPGGINNSTVQSVVSQYHLYNRAGWGIQQLPVTNPYSLVAYPGDYTDLDEAKNVLDQVEAENSWLIFLAHGWGSTSDYQQIAQEVSNRGIPVKTVREIMTGSTGSSDTVPPETTLDLQDGSYLDGLQTDLAGTATDNSAVAAVMIAIRRTTDNNYWTGSSWVSSEAWLPATITSGAQTPAATWSYSWNLPTSDGESFMVAAKARDSAGGTDPSPAEAEVRVDNVAPSGSVLINNDDAYTNSATIALSLSATDGGSVQEMAFSNDSNNWTPWEQYQVNKSWSLASENGNRPVYVNYRDARGNESAEPFTDSIYLDLFNPESQISPLPVFTNESNLTVSWDGTDDESGIDGYDLQFRRNGGLWQDWLTQTTAISGDMSFAQGDGVYDFRVRAYDKAGNTEQYPSASDAATTVDRQAPADPNSLSSTSHQIDEQSSDNTIDVVWSGATDDLSGVDGYSVKWSAQNPGIPDSVKDLEETVLSATSPPLSDGPWYFDLRTVDNAGNWTSTLHLGPFITELGAPNTVLSTTPATNNGYEDWFASTPMITLTRNEAGTTYMQFDSTASLGFVTGDTTIAPEGQHTLYYYSVDTAGNTETVKNQLFKVDNTDPIDPSILSPSHTEDATSTDSTIDMNIQGATDTISGVIGYSVSWSQDTTELPDTTLDMQQSDNSTTSPSLSAGNWYFNLRTKDVAGNWTATVHAGPYRLAVVDNTPPTTTIETSPTPADGDSGWFKTTPTITLNRNEAGTTSYQWDSTSTDEWQVYSGEAIAGVEGEHVLYYYSADDAANQENIKNQKFRIDTSEPSGSILINHGSAYARSRKVNLKLAGSDAGSGIDVTRVKNHGRSWSAWQESDDFNAWTLTSGDGIKRVYVQVRDDAGNVSTTVSDTIELDTKKPIARMETPFVSTRISKTTTFKVKWWITEPSPSSGLEYVNVYYRPSTSSKWRRWKSGTAASGQAYFTGRAGSTYYFRTLVVDNAHNYDWSKTYKTIVPFNEGIYKSRTGFGGYTKSSKSQNFLTSVRYSYSAGHTLIYKLYNNNGIGLVVTKGPKMGRAQIYIDGKYVETVDAHSSKTKARQLIYYKGFSKTGTHWLKVVNLGTPGRARFEVDGVVVGR